MTGLREWTVASGLVETPAGLLLVRNRRRGGREDWSPPGGVVDDSDRDPISALTREVREETGLLVADWRGPLYVVTARAPDMGWRMRADVYVACDARGVLQVADPDGIVVEADYVPEARIDERLATGPPWVREPLRAWLAERWPLGVVREFEYDVHGVDLADLRVVCTRWP